MMLEPSNSVSPRTMDTQKAARKSEVARLFPQLLYTPTAAAASFFLVH